MDTSKLLNHTYQHTQTENAHYMTSRWVSSQQVDKCTPENICIFFSMTNCVSPSWLNNIWSTRFQHPRLPKADIHPKNWWMGLSYFSPTWACVANSRTRGYEYYRFCVFKKSTCMSTSLQVYMYVCVHDIHTYTYTYMHACMYISMHICMYVYVYLYP